MKKLLAIMLVLPFPMYGYIDPGSGSYLLQILIASGLGGLYAIKTYWAYIKNYFFGEKNKKE